MKRTIQQLLELGVPLALGFVSQMAISFTDAALVARLGAPELAGTTLALSIFSVVMLLGLGIITAASPKTADSYKSENLKDLRMWYGQGVWLSLIVGLFGTLVLLNTRTLLTAMGQSPEIATIAQDYNTGASTGLIFFLLYVNSRNIMSSVGKPKPLTWIMLAAIPLNVIVGYIAIFGFPGFTGAGVFGAGLSSTIIRSAIIVAATLVLFRSKHFKDLQLFTTFQKPRLSKLTELLKLGLPIGFRILVGEGYLPILAFFIASFGASATASHAIGLRVENLVSVVALGLSTAATTLSAWSRADSDRASLLRLRKAMLIVSIGYVAIVAAVLLSTFPYIQRTIFSVEDERVIALTTGLLPLIIILLAADILGGMYNGFLVGMEDTFIPTIVVTANYWIVGIGVGLALSELTPIGFYGLWIGMVLASLLVAIFNYIRVGWNIRRIGLKVAH